MTKAQSTHTYEKMGTHINKKIRLDLQRKLSLIIEARSYSKIQELLSACETMIIPTQECE